MGDKVVFLRKISPGGADRSYGIQVGKLAGLPDEVVKRAQEILLSLENGSEHNSPIIERIKIGKKEEGESHPVISLSNRPNWRNKREDLSALPLFNQAKEEHPLIKEIKELDIQNMTPLEALNKLNQLKEIVKSYSMPGQLISIPRNQQKG